MDVLLAMVLAAALPDLPITAATSGAFIPKGWAMELQLDGPLVTMASADRVLVLLEADKGGDNRRRALVVLKQEKSGYSLLGSNVGLLACLSCLGVKGGEAAPELSIEKRVLVVTQFGGSREYYGAVHRLRVEKAGLRLIGVDHSSGDGLTGERADLSENLITGLCVEEKVAASPEGGPEQKPVSRRFKRAVKPLPPLEELVEYGG